MNKLFSFFDKKIRINIPVYVPLLLPFAAYLLWEIYWAVTVGYPVVKWHTHLMIFVYPGLLTLLILKFKNDQGGLSEKSKLVALLCFSLLFAFFAAESFFVITGKQKTYMEVLNGYYCSPYAPQEKNYYHVWTPNIPHQLKKPEYSYMRPTNSLGFADEEWSVAKKPGEKRVMCLGDSFTEGDGAPFDSSYVALMRGMVTEAGMNCYVMNAGVCGSDPFNNFVNLRDKLVDFRPDLIIQSFGSGDMLSDIQVRGGMERFQKNGTVKYDGAPWWEPIFALSYTSRIFFRSAGYNELLRNVRLNPEEKKLLDTKITDLYRRYAELCKSDNIRLVIVLHPEKEEIEHNKYNYELLPLTDQLKKNYGIEIVDLLPYYRKYIERTHTKVEDYYWHYDGHHNSKGYKMMAECTLENILPLLSDSSTVQQH